jgi:hypothetical protein
MRCCKVDLYQVIEILPDGRVRNRGQYVDRWHAEVARSADNEANLERRILEVPHGVIWPRKSPTVSARTFAAWVAEVNRIAAEPHI